VGEEKRVVGRTVGVFGVLGLVCGLVSAGIFQWWWGGQPESSVVIGEGPETGRPTWGRVIASEGPAVDGWLYVALVAVPVVLGLLGGVLVSRAGWGLSRVR